jgi:hypothetical protein
MTHEKTSPPTESLESAGYDPRPVAPESHLQIYFTSLKALLTRPREFFRSLKHPIGVARPLLFGVITHWVGSALSYLWFSGLGRLFERHFSSMFQALDQGAEIDSSGQLSSALAMRSQIMDWMFGVASVLIDPFKTTLRILFIAFFVWVGARLLASLKNPEAEKRMGFDSAVAIVGFSMAASLFNAIPVVGGMIALIFGTVLSIIGASEIFQVKTGRAMVIALFPNILLFGLFFAAFIAFFSAVAMLLMR